MAEQQYTLGGQKYTTTGEVPVGGTKIYDQGTSPVIPATNPNNPIISSSDTRASYDALGNDISTFTNAAGLSSSNDRATKILEDRMDQMKSDYEADIGGIKSSYEEANRIQGDRQNKDYAGRSTGLVTSGGGFLGTTQSQQGVLQNLNDTFTNEKNALMSKRDAALQAARSAYDDKSFAVALEQLKDAKDTEKTLYDRQKDYADQSLKLAQENRAQTTFDIGLTDKKIEAYTAMSDAEFAKQDQSQIAALDQSYYPGYTAAARLISKKALDTKTTKDAIDLDSSIIDMRLKIPQGQKFKLNGTTYTGLKQPEKTSTADLQKLEDDDVASAVVNFQNLITKNKWAGVNPADYVAVREILQSKYGASAALKLDKELKALDIEVDYDNE